MSTPDRKRASDAEIYDREESPQEVGGCDSDGRITVSGSGSREPRASSPPKHIHDPTVDAASQLPRKSESLNEVSVDSDKSARAASPRLTSERILPHSSSQDTGVLGLGEANGGADSSLSQDSNRRGHATDEISPEEMELRRPPSPFVLLDADPTRPELPSEGWIVPVIEVGSRTVNRKAGRRNGRQER